MTDKPASTAPDGDVWDDDILTDDLTSVKQNFSVDDEAYLSAVAGQGTVLRPAYFRH
ncbi:MAG: hypothetical protein II272_00370 [Oscillospiraceae bacterium]|nr:hypothetical protein [Oscillospiraceae bacterium]